jgi:hypothetical protein
MHVDAKVRTASNKAATIALPDRVAWLTIRQRRNCSNATVQEGNNARFGSLADISECDRHHVRFTPKSGHVRCNYDCPLRAKSGHKVRAALTYGSRRISGEKVYISITTAAAAMT